MRILEKKVYCAIYNWINHKSLKNFCVLYRDSFCIRHIWWRPLWRCWRIFKHTYLDGRYERISADEKMHYLYIEKMNTK